MTPDEDRRQQRRTDGTAKVSGRATYAYDIKLPRMLHAKVLRSPHPSAEVVRIDTTRAAELDGVHAVLTRDNLEGIDPYCGTFVKDQPFVALERVRYVGDPVAAVAAVDERTALAALDLVEVEYRLLPAVGSIEDSLRPDAPELFPEGTRGVVPAYGAGASASLRSARNVCYEFRYETGSDDVWDECDHIFEDEFRFSRMNHMHLEPFVCVADADAEHIEVWSATQGPFPLRKDLARIFAMPENAIRVHVETVGGSFGAKNGPRTEPVAIRLSQLSGHPVRYCMALEEALLTNTQHAAILKVTAGVKADGTFVARRSEVLLDAGAYADYSPLVVEKAGYRMPGAYRWQRIDSTCKAVLTNTVPAGAFRGFGGTQATWAGERQVDLIAERLGIDPYELRLKNLKDLGEEYVPGETPIDCDFRMGLELVAEAIGYHDRLRIPNRGMGVAIGTKDGGGVNKPARARVRVSTTGAVYLESALVEMGQGGHTALVQIVAEVLDTPVERVHYVSIDTDHSPFDQGTNASSGVAVMGRAVKEAADQVRQQILAFASESLGVAATSLKLRDWTVYDGATAHAMTPLVNRVYGGTGFEFSADGYYKALSTESAPLEARCIFWESGWAAAEVEVDPETGRVRLLQLAVSEDAGRIINARGCRGQEEGSAVFAIGQALFEEMRFEGTTLLNGDALDYRVPLAEDLPPTFRSMTQEQGHGAGPFGAKGMGEGTILPVAPAIAAAIADAVGAQLTALPMSPERVLDAIDAVNDPGHR